MVVCLELLKVETMVKKQADLRVSKMALTMVVEMVVQRVNYSVDYSVESKGASKGAC